MPGLAYVVGKTYFDTEHYDVTDPARNFEERRRRCYELAGAALMFGSAPPASTLVHGTMDGHTGFGRLGHAWLVLPDGRVWEPITGDLHASVAAWRQYADAVDVVTYTLDEARRMSVVHETFGPWHPHDYR